jgi:hypothetical protein
MRAAIVVAGFFLAGCTATKATIHLVAADQALGRASEHGAAERAPYEYTLAVRYLEKAREEAGYSEYKVASSLARQAADYADQAIIVIEKQGGARMVDAAGRDLSDGRTPRIEMLDEPAESK